MTVLEWRYRFYRNVGSQENPVWSKRHTYTYQIDLDGINYETLSSDAIEGILIKTAEKRSSKWQKIVFVDHDVKYVSFENELKKRRTEGSVIEQLVQKTKSNQIK
jgi:hypothetical protein